MPTAAAPSAERNTGRASAAQPVLDMLAAFRSVGAERFDLTLTDATGGKVAFRGDRPLDVLNAALPRLLENATQQQHNVIVRPKGSGPALIQLDDLDAAAEARLRPVSFLTLRTSPSNHQAWVAVADSDADFARRLRKGTGADLTASGATRVSGSLNFKEKYAAAGFPVIETVHTSPGLVVTRAELEALGVVSPPEKLAPARPARVSPGSGRRGWPNYERCVAGAPEARDGGRPDISRADFTFCLLALDWGWSIEEAAERLMQESSKARENGERYALRTAQNAAAALARRHGPQR